MVDKNRKKKQQREKDKALEPLEHGIRRSMGLGVKKLL